MDYRLRPTTEFLEEVRKLDHATNEQVRKRLDKIKQNPHLSKPLKHAANLFSERIGGWRILFEVAKDEVILYHIRKRKEAY